MTPAHVAVHGWMTRGKARQRHNTSNKEIQSQCPKCRAWAWRVVADLRKAKRCRQCEDLSRRGPGYRMRIRPKVSIRKKSAGVIPQSVRELASVAHLTIKNQILRLREMGWDDGDIAIAVDMSLAEMRAMVTS